MRALDLFCGAGGASVGLTRAGFDVVWGVDIKKQPRYPRLLVGPNFRDNLHLDALQLSPAWVADNFDFVWASPPCQKHTKMKTMHNARDWECLIDPTRNLLTATGLPYAIENVPDAPLRSPICLCGTGLGCHDTEWEMQRHRNVEANFELWGSGCDHQVHRSVLGVYGDHIRCRKRRAGSKDRGVEDPPLALAQRLMGIDWMTLHEMSEAIPPTYSHWVGTQAIEHMKAGIRHSGTGTHPTLA